MKSYILLLSFGVFLIGCNNSNKSDYTSIKNSDEAVKPHPGKKLMETNCYICHSPDANHDNRIGPPMQAVKSHYIKDNTTKKEFIADVQAWIKNPIIEKSKMPGAVRRFGVMPKTPFPEETIAQIADYMFENDIDQSEFSRGHMKNGMGNQKVKRKHIRAQRHKQQANKESAESSYGERGLNYALSTKAVLGKNLIGTIQKKGTLEALSFCNERALPLTDSMAKLYNVNIKRVTDKPRNSENQANLDELIIIDRFKIVAEKKLEPNPVVIESHNKVNFYYPITTNEMCLQCHGKPNQTILPNTLKSLATLYPNDKAIGYDINQVRGIWSISFKTD